MTFKPTVLKACASSGLLHRHLLHTSANAPGNNKSSSPQQEMNFLKAADILSSEEDPKRRKKFGWDFHLWQAFVACLPSVAVYLTAQYARRKMRKMEEVRDRENAKKMKAEEERQEEEARKSPVFRILDERLSQMEDKISKIETRSPQSKVEVATRDGQSKDVEQHRKDTKAGDAKSFKQENGVVGDTKAGETASLAKDKPKEVKKDVEKAEGAQPNGGGMEKPASKTELVEKVRDDKKVEK